MGSNLETKFLDSTVFHVSLNQRKNILSKSPLVGGGGDSDSRDEEVLSGNSRTDICSKDPEAVVDFTTNQLWKNVSRYKIMFDQNKNLSKSRLRVFVLPHSHVDPGWLKTFDQYYDEKVRNILSHMVRYLFLEPKMKFIWSETSFLEKWWNEATDEQKSHLKTIVSRGQLELTGGAWVMTDEATPHFWASIDNLIEGHQFLYRSLGIRPTTSWSVDPFGHGATVPYLLGLSGIKKLVIGRVHMQIKAQLRKNRRLVFNWRQSWDENNETDALVHVLPRMVYITSDGCGPDEKVCCKYDFGPSSMYHCNQPKLINQTNVKYYAELLADQLRKLSADFFHPVLLFPVGADFRYDMEQDYPITFQSFTALFQYMNTSEKMNIQGEFGTVSDYLKAVEESVSRNDKLTTIAGDFFPYSDFPPKNHWTGYFTTRPFYKRLDRILQSHLRAADILYSLAASRVLDENWKMNAFNQLLMGRRELALFQHHDAITGTSKKAVMADYLQRLQNSWHLIASVMESATSILLSKEYKLYQGQHSAINQSDLLPIVKLQQKLPALNSPSSQQPVEIKAGEKMYIFIFNSIPRRRTLPVRLQSTCLYPEVRAEDGGSPVTVQVNPVFSFHGFSSSVISAEVFEMVFLLTVEPLALRKMLVSCRSMPAPSVSLASVCATTPFRSTEPFLVQHNSCNEYLGTKNMNMSFNLSSGSLSVFNNTNASVSFWKYFSQGGAYLFRPHGLPIEIAPHNLTVVKIEGPVVVEFHSFSTELQQSYFLYETEVSDVVGQSLHMKLIPDMSRAKNQDFVMRIHFDAGWSTSRNSTFYVDSNGLQLLRRRYNSRVPVEGNYFPIASAFLVQKTLNSRMTLLTGQPHGGTSHSEADMEVMVDRVQSSDDGEGLSEAPDDSARTEQVFSLVLEGPIKAELKYNAYHSAAARETLNNLLYPFQVFTETSETDDSEKPKLSNGFKFIRQNFAPGWDLVNIRPLNVTSSLLLLFYSKNHCSRHEALADPTAMPAVESILKFLRVKRIHRSNLSGTMVLREDKNRQSSDIRKSPIAIYSYIIEH